MDFLFHKVSEKEKEEIKKQAREILDSFSKKLSMVKEKLEEPIIEREKSDRDEDGKKCEADHEFRRIFFENAPKKNKDFIIAEKGKW